MALAAAGDVRADEPGGPALAEALWDDVAASWPAPERPIRDRVLDEVARQVAADVLAGGVQAEEGRGFTTVQTRLWEHGVLDPRPTFAAVIYDGTLAAEALRGAVGDVPDLERYDHAGLGLAADGPQRCAAVVLVQRHLDVEQAPDWSPRTTQTLAFVPRAGWSRWRVDVLGPGAEVLPVELARDDARWTARFELGADPGVYRVEVVAHDGTGWVLAGLGVGTVPGKLRAPADPEAYLARWIAVERQRFELSALTRHPPLDELARDHSERLRDGVPFGHDGGGGDPVERIRAAGIPFSVALENVGRATTLDWVHTLVMASPRHRANLLHPRLTHVGIGVARVEPLAWYATVDLVRLLEPLDLDRARERIEAALDEGRQASGLPALGHKRALDRVADAWCREVAGATELSPDQIAALTEDVRFHLDDAERVVADLLVVDDVEALTWFPALADPAFDQAGLGLHQPADGGRVTVLLVLVARSTGG